MKHHILGRLIWVFAVCICFFFACTQPVLQVRPLNFRLAMPVTSPQLVDVHFVAFVMRDLFHCKQCMPQIACT